MHVCGWKTELGRAREEEEEEELAQLVQSMEFAFQLGKRSKECNNEKDGGTKRAKVRADSYLNLNIVPLPVIQNSRRRR